MSRHLAPFALVLLFALAACDSQDPEPSGELVPGIEVRSEANGYMGWLGEPVAHGPANGAVRLHAPYPNPSMGQTTLPFSVMQAGPVALGVERLQPTAALHQTVTGAIPGFSSGSAQVVRSYPAEPRAVGSFQFIWDGLDDAGQPAGTGYYRVTLTAGAELHSMDVILVRSEADMLALRAAASR
jgi:hypothetical protein